MSDETNGAPQGTLDMLRIDLQESLNQSTINPRSLSSFQRILLTTDGTVTEILEAYLWESMQVIKLDQDMIETQQAIPYLELPLGAKVMLRRILLRGKTSHKNYIYAESIVVPDRLNDTLRDGLMSTKKPLGQLMIETRLETFREILNCRREPAEELGAYFDVDPGSMLISRTYRVFCERKPLMLITEKFPEGAFQDHDR
jgi:chorismate-pyruvate lyase